MVIFGHNNKTSMVIIDYIRHRPKISIVIFETVPKFGLGCIILCLTFCSDI
jgi:hypothetical protein